MLSSVNVNIWTASILVLASLSAIFVSCTSKKHKDLISFEATYFRDLTLEEYEKGGLVAPEILQSTANNILTITLFQQQSGCMAFDGNIHIEGDTLFLNYWHSNDEVCDELVIYKMEYRIKNTSKKNYFVKPE